MVTISGSGSTWNNSGELNVGCQGNGTLIITGGGAVSIDGPAYIGLYDGSTGVVTIDGASQFSCRPCTLVITEA